MGKYKLKNISAVLAVLSAAFGLMAFVASADTNGVLVKSIVEPEVFVVKNGVRRHIADPKVFSDNGFKWENILIAPKAVLEEIPLGEELKGREGQVAGASTSGKRLIRATGDFKVFEIDEQGNKHWLNMTAEDFVKSGRRFENVEVVDAAEVGRHTTADDIFANGQSQADVKRADLKKEDEPPIKEPTEEILTSGQGGQSSAASQGGPASPSLGGPASPSLGGPEQEIAMTPELQAKAGIVINAGAAGPGYPTGPLNLVVPAVQLFLDREGQVKNNGQLEITDRQYEAPVEAFSPVLPAFSLTINGAANTANEIKVVSNLKTQNDFGSHGGTIDVDVDTIPAGHLTLQYNGMALITGSTITSSGTFRTSEATGIFAGLVAEGTYEMTIIESGQVFGSPATFSITTVSP